MTVYDRIAIFLLLSWDFIEMYDQFESPPFHDRMFIFRGLMVAGYAIFILAHRTEEHPHES